MKRALFLSTIGILTMAGTATAQSETPEVVYRDVTIVDMPGVDVTGGVVGPNGAIVTVPRRPQFNPMIKLRKDFDDAVEQSVDEVQ